MSKMIPDLENYFRGLVPPRDELLLELEKAAFQENIPIGVRSSCCRFCPSMRPKPMACPWRCGLNSPCLDRRLVLIIARILYGVLFRRDDDLIVKNPVAQVFNLGSRWHPSRLRKLSSN